MPAPIKGPNNPPPRGSGGPFGSRGPGGGYPGSGGGRPPDRPPQRGDSEGVGPDWERLLRPPEKRFIYFAPNSNAPRPEMLDREAEEVAKLLATLPSSQIRRFYSAVMALRRRLEHEREKVPDEEIRAQLALLKAQAAYTCRRGKDYPTELVAFFTRHADAVRTRDDFKLGFQKHFEAVIAYHKVFERKRGEER